MTHKNILICVFFLLIPSVLISQNFSLGFTTGIGTFSMNSCRELNEAIRQNLPFEAKVVNDFPPYLYYELELASKMSDQFTIGFHLGTTSTGSRISLTDYSGKYLFDNVQKSYMLGIRTYLGRFAEKKLSLRFTFSAGMNISYMSITESLVISGVKAEDKMKFTSTGFFLEPGANLIKRIFQNIFIAADLSYFFGGGSGYHLQHDKNAILHNPANNKVVKPGWNGIRFGLTINWYFK